MKLLNCIQPASPYHAGPEIVALASVASAALVWCADDGALLLVCRSATSAAAGLTREAVLVGTVLDALVAGVLRLARLVELLQVGVDMAHKKVTYIAQKQPAAPTLRSNPALVQDSIVGRSISESAQSYYRKLRGSAMEGNGKAGCKGLRARGYRLAGLTKQVSRLHTMHLPVWHLPWGMPERGSLGPQRVLSAMGLHVPVAGSHELHSSQMTVSQRPCARRESRAADQEKGAGCAHVAEFGVIDAMSRQCDACQTRPQTPSHSQLAADGLRLLESRLNLPTGWWACRCWC